MSGKPYTPEERATIIDLLKRGLRPKVVALRVGRSRNAIGQIANSIGIRFRKRPGCGAAPSARKRPECGRNDIPPRTNLKPCRPTKHLPGTPELLEVRRLRVLNGEEMFHDQDGRVDE
jgi:hypothetical protein